MSSPGRIGVYGGTFDPIHLAHVKVARAAQENAGLDEVLFVVSAAPPHKGGGVHAPAEDRYAMVEAALADEAGLRASRIELDRAGPSYTVDTLAALREAHPGSALFLIVGQDMLVDIVNWRRPGEILSMAGLLAVPRPGVHPKLPPTLTGHFSMLPFPENELSSTEVRGRLARGEEVSNLLAPAVLRIIKEKDLYHAAGEDAAL